MPDVSGSIAARSVCRLKRRQNLSEEEKKENKKYMATYRKENKAKALTYIKLPKVREKDLARKKQPKAKVKRNKRLRDIRYYETDARWGYNANCEFLQKANNHLFSGDNLEKLERRKHDLIST